MPDAVPADFSITIPVTLRRRGVETKLIIEPSDGRPRLDPDPTLIKLVAQAHQWREDILAGRFPTMRSLAKAYDKDERHVARLIPLAFLAPTIVEAVIAGSQPTDLVAQDLIMLRELPAEWKAQRAMLGFVLPQRLVDLTSRGKAKTSREMAWDAGHDRVSHHATGPRKSRLEKTHPSGAGNEAENAPLRPPENDPAENLQTVPRARISLGPR